MFFSVLVKRFIRYFKLGFNVWRIRKIQIGYFATKHGHTFIYYLVGQRWRGGCVQFIFRIHLTI